MLKNTAESKRKRREYRPESSSFFVLGDLRLPLTCMRSDHSHGLYFIAPVLGKYPVPARVVLILVGSLLCISEASAGHTRLYSI